MIDLSTMAFECWVERQQQGSKPLSKASLKVYQAMWGAWCAWLQRQPTPWDAVTPAVVEGFLAGPAPTTANRRRALNPSSMSNYHRQRYWRVLHGVYGEAVRQGWVTINPAGELDENERPHISDQSRIAQILPPGLLELLRDPKVLCRVLLEGTAQDWTYLRDRAIFALISHAALTTAELAALRGQDIRQGGEPLITALGRGTQHRLDDGEANPYWVDVANASGTVWRSLSLSSEALASIEPWIRKREQLLRERALRYGHCDDQDSLNAPLFPSRRSLPKEGAIGAMVPATIYVAVREGFKAVYQLPDAQGLNKREPGINVEQGAAIIRNSVLQQWLDSYGIQETIMRAGLKHPHSLRLLRNTPVDTASHG